MRPSLENGEMSRYCFALLRALLCPAVSLLLTVKRLEKVFDANLALAFTESFTVHAPEFLVVTFPLFMVHAPETDHVLTPVEFVVAIAEVV